MRVLITDGDTRQALAATRSLGRIGHFVVVAADRWPSLAGQSRYAASSVACPSPMERSDAFVDSVVKLARQHGVEVILPMTEISTLLLTRERHRLPPGCALPFPSHRSVGRASNKAEVVNLARDLGVPVPETTIVAAFDDLSAIERIRSFPVVVKPACSRVWADAGWISNSVSYAADLGELRDRLRGLSALSFPVLLQERIHGPGVGIFMLCEHGRPIARFAHRRIREKPPSGGVSVLCESAPVDEVAAVHAEALLGSLDWSGPAMVEFKRDLRDGSLRLMEINGRFWGSLQLAVDAGVDFPALLVQAAAGLVPESIPEYRCGVRCRWLAGDLDALLMVLLKGRDALALPPDHPGRLRSLWDFVRVQGRDVRYEFERRDDLAPAMLEWRRRLLRH